MKFKRFILLTLILISSVFIYGCNGENIVPEPLPLEESIKEIINSKGKDYDFLSDELFIEKVNELGLSKDFVLGNLDEDNVPELVSYISRDHNNLDDQGKLQVYKFDGEKYLILDSMDMNYDNSNYLLVVGKISKDQNGILLSNEVGAHSTITYGYILENGKLKSIFNDKKIGLLSTYAMNEIKDIDNDGVLEFSIYTNDPESIDQSAAGSDKIVLWYKWDGIDSGEIIQIEKFSTEDNRGSMRKLDADLSNPDDSKTLSYLLEHSSDYDKYGLTQVIDSYITRLDENRQAKSLLIDDLFRKYQKTNVDYLLNEYGLSLERLNDIDYLKRERTLSKEIDLKDSLIQHLSMGYKLESSEGIMYYLIDNQQFLDSFGQLITNEYRDYLKIKARESNNLHQMGGKLMISRDRLTDRIIEIEAFRRNYPYSGYIKSINEMYFNYVTAYLYGTHISPNYDLTTNVYGQGSLAIFKDTIANYQDYYFSDIIQRFEDELTINNNVLTDDIRELINDIIL